MTEKKVVDLQVSEENGTVTTQVIKDAEGGCAGGTCSNFTLWQACSGN